MFTHVTSRKAQLRQRKHDRLDYFEPAIHLCHFSHSFDTVVIVPVQEVRGPRALLYSVESQYQYSLRP